MHHTADCIVVVVAWLVVNKTVGTIDSMMYGIGS